MDSLWGLSYTDFANDPSQELRREKKNHPARWFFGWQPDAAGG